MWAGLQCLCVGQGTCSRGLEEDRAQKGSCLHVCQGSVSLPSTDSAFSQPLGTWGELEQGLKGAVVPARKGWGDTGPREAWQELHL